MQTILMIAALLAGPAIYDQSKWPEGTRSSLEAIEQELIATAVVQEPVGVVVVGNPGSTVR